MDMKQIVQDRLRELGRGNTVAERIGGLGKSFITNLLASSKASVRAENLPKLAKALDWTVEDITSRMNAGTPKPSGGFGFAGGSAVHAAVTLPDLIEMPRNMPILGVAAGASVGAFIVDGVIDYVRRPPTLVHSVNSYGLYIVGNSMSPKYEPGDLVFVNPDRPAANGDIVIIQTRAFEGDITQGWIKRLVKISDEKVVVEQINPEKLIEYDRSTVVSIHRVMKTSELFGV